ncbi:MAG: putative 2-dehydropantoate 2-reductase [Kiritimatiellaceae bacterium]|nr:putative 2-dehydropantoate 2-reductase [Kiritimatiellaceae bacterium]
MQTNYQFSIVGTGAVGGYYGALLQQAKFDVHFLLNSDYTHVRKNGLVIESPNGNFKLPDVNAYSAPQEMPRCDVVIVALKTTANAVLKNILPHLVKEDSMVLTLQNGLGSEEQVAKIVKPEQILGGLCFLCSNKVAPGHIRHLDYGLITLGEFSQRGLTPRLKNLGQQMELAGIPIRLINDLPLARWKKLVWNIPFNGLSVVRNQLTDQLIRQPETRKLCIAMMREVAEASKACARPINKTFIEKMINDTEKMEPYAPSMKLDFDRGNALEIEAIYGEPIRRAKAAGVAMPETENLYMQLKDINPV